MKRWILRCKDWAVPRAGSTEVSTHCTAIMGWPSSIPRSVWSLSANSNDPFTVPPGQRDGASFQYCTGLKCPWIKIQDHSCSWGWAGGPSLVLAVSSCCQGGPAELWDHWVGGHGGQHQGRERAGKPAWQGSVSENGWGTKWPAASPWQEGAWEVGVEDRILDSNCRSWPMKLMLDETSLLLCHVIKGVLQVELLSLHEVSHMPMVGGGRSQPYSEPGLCLPFLWHNEIYCFLEVGADISSAAVFHGNPFVV